MSPEHTESRVRAGTIQSFAYAGKPDQPPWSQHMQLLRNTAFIGIQEAGSGNHTAQSTAM